MTPKQAATKSLNKEALISAMAESSGLTKTDASRALAAFIESVEKALKEGGEVRLVGFGTFSVTNRPAREGRNPRTGEPLKLAASKSPKFQAGAVFKKAIA